MKKERPPHLRVVDVPPSPRALATEDVAPPPEGTLFAHANENLIAFVQLETAPEDFRQLIATSRPRFVFDLRRAPRFDIPPLSRQAMFSAFEESGTTYIDVSGKMELRSTRDSRLNPKLLSEHIWKLAFSRAQRFQGPLVFIVEQSHLDESYLTEVAKALTPGPEEGWHIVRLPVLHSSQSAHRKILFISHATPDDNSFALWLGAQLTNHGYQVWSDVTRLLGGEIIWDTIEAVIRNHAAKVLVVMSPQGHHKSGVLDEVHCAVGVERSQGIERFLVPLRLGNLPYAEVRANLARRNIIDFSDNWAEGFRSLLKSLQEDSVPVGTTSSQITKIFVEATRGDVRLSPTPERLASNWTFVREFPSHVRMFDVNGSLDDVERFARELEWPTFRYLRLVGTCAAKEDFAGNSDRVTQRYEIPIDKFLLGRSEELPGMKARDAHNHLSGMLRAGTERMLMKRAAVGHVLASGRQAFYFPKDAIESDQVRYKDVFGRNKRKKLVGRSEKRDVYWHFAVTPYVTLGRSAHLSWRSHVIFSEDGKSPIESAARQHRLRRSFCRSWWNDRWRDLTEAFVSTLSADTETIEVQMGTNAQLVLEPQLGVFLSPVSLEDAASRHEQLASDDDDLDDIDIELDELDEFVTEEGWLPDVDD